MQSSVSSLRAQWTSELARLKGEVDQRRRLAAAALKAKQEEEDMKARAVCGVACLRGQSVGDANKAKVMWVSG